MKLEEVQPENTLSAQLGALFLEANEVFSEVCQRGRRYTTARMISEVLNIVKLKNIANRVLEASEPSKSNREIVSDVLNIVQPKKIAERIEASKPSRSSSPITTDMVGFVETLLDCTMSCLNREHGCHHGSAMLLGLPKPVDGYVSDPSEVVYLCRIRDGCGSHFAECYSHFAECYSHFGESEQLSASVLEQKLQPLRVLFILAAKWCTEHESMMRL
ncbi:hypothetical protein RND71_023118 [Anisodus tanguticus]|uniref:Uncharacterized protein n=1 Tax=Anisodus tanguticus TaxID=243964 RepID=A0AAE1RTB4_9SOLA|nr:hypothetical protein RND71_023118 [Anisodus tanguticus]